MANFSVDSVIAAIERIKNLYSKHTDGEVAELFGISRQVLSQWKGTGKLDIAHIISQLPELSIDWLLYGVGEPTLYSDRLDIMEPIRRVSEESAEYLQKSVQFPTLGMRTKKNRADNNDLENELKESATIPIFYGVSAGNPTETFNELKGYYKYDYLINERTIGIDMNTDEYKGYGFDKGDVVIIDTVREPQSGNVVLVKMEKVFDLLYYYDTNESIYYEKIVEGSKNKKYSVDNLIDVAGVAIAKIRKL